ncbi:MAG TPA: hypothetical protein VK130_07590 [Steroidobacteraceae bacterium]|nr:hypothetical protein [Steroidobacteraceae bacterium]
MSESALVGEMLGATASKLAEIKRRGWDMKDLTAFFELVECLVVGTRPLVIRAARHEAAAAKARAARHIPERKRVLEEQAVLRLFTHLRALDPDISKVDAIERIRRHFRLPKTRVKGYLPKRAGRAVQNSQPSVRGSIA